MALQGHDAAGIRRRRDMWLPRHMVRVLGGRAVAKSKGWNTHTVSLSLNNASPNFDVHALIAAHRVSFVISAFASHGEEKSHALFVCAPLTGRAPWLLARWPSISRPPSSIVVSMFAARRHTGRVRLLSDGTPGGVRLSPSSLHPEKCSGW